MDLLARTAELVAIPSVSHDEAALADHVESVLRSRTGAPTSIGIGANVVARTELGRATPGGPGRSPRHRAGQRQRRPRGSRATPCGASGAPT